MGTAMLRIGTAGWSIPRDVAEGLPPAASALHRYAGVFDAVEINSSFYRPHRPSTYARWAASVGDAFRFAVKLPRSITHDAKLVGADALIDQFLAETSWLGAKRGPILVQTPPKLAFDAPAAARVAHALRSGGADLLAWEPRHATWFEPDVDRWLADHRIARVAADPARPSGAGQPGGWRGLTYHRLHGSPRMYYSAYDEATLARLAETLRTDEASERWCVFDNTAAGDATRDALTLASLVSGAVSAP